MTNDVLQLNPSVNPFQRSFVGAIRRIDEMARRVRFFTTQIEKVAKDCSDWKTEVLTIIDRERNMVQSQLDLINRTLQQMQRDSEAHLRELQRQLDYVKKTAEAESARLQRRAEAEMADLRATISRLEVDLMKVSLQRPAQVVMPLTATAGHESKVARDPGPSR